MCYNLNMKIIFNFKQRCRTHGRQTVELHRQYGSENKMKRKLAFLLTLCFGWSVFFSGCGGTLPKPDGKLQVVCTIFPEYDWARQLTQGVDSVDLTLLVKNGTDLHSYQPSVKDIAAISRADVFCYVGGVSDTWVNDVLDTTENHTAKLVSMVDATHADEEVLAEGMQDDDHHHHDHDHDHDHDAEEETEVDEHVWLSLRRAQLACAAMRDALCQADPSHAEAYQANYTAYAGQLQALDAEYQTMTETAERSTIVVADRFPFRYLAEDYGLTYYAAFPGCSAETEASFETIVFLSDKVKSLGLSCVLTMEGSNHSLAKTILENACTDGSILTLQSLQAVSQSEIDQGATYLSKMQENYSVLEKALNEGSRETWHN